MVAMVRSWEDQEGDAHDDAAAVEEISVVDDIAVVVNQVGRKSSCPPFLNNQHRRYNTAMIPQAAKLNTLTAPVEVQNDPVEGVEGVDIDLLKKIILKAAVVR